LPSVLIFSCPVCNLLCPTLFRPRAYIAPPEFPLKPPPIQVAHHQKLPRLFRVFLRNCFQLFFCPAPRPFGFDSFFFFFFIFVVMPPVRAGFAAFQRLLSRTSFDSWSSLRSNPLWPRSHFLTFASLFFFPWHGRSLGSRAAAYEFVLPTSSLCPGVTLCQRL